MRPFSAYAIGLLLGVAAIGPVLAQDKSAMQAILADKTAQQHVIDAAKKSTVFIKNPCPDAKFTFTGNIAIYAMPERDGSGQIGKGAWKEEVREEGCGQNRMLNVLGVVRGPGTLETMPLLPGTTHGDPRLQRDAVQFAAIQAGVNRTDCADGYVADTRFVDQEEKPIAGGKNPPWRESWTIVACGRKAEVPMRFIPDATGTKVAAEPAKFTPPEQKK